MSFLEMRHQVIELDDVIKAVENCIGETGLKVLSSSNSLKF